MVRLGLNSQGIATMADASAEKPAVDALQKGLNDLQLLCDVITEEFGAKRSEYAEGR
jgi:DNA-directed RNA polymerase subunit L